MIDGAGVKVACASHRRELHRTILHENDLKSELLSTLDMACPVSRFWQNWWWLVRACTIISPPPRCHPDVDEDNQGPSRGRGTTLVSNH
eukprot:scaffold5478_cov161-Amphora_coffeaeformis.AAC.11